MENILRAAANEINVIKEKLEKNSAVIQNRNRNTKLQCNLDRSDVECLPK